MEPVWAGHPFPASSAIWSFLADGFMSGGWSITIRSLFGVSVFKSDNGSSEKTCQYLPALKGPNLKNSIYLDFMFGTGMPWSPLGYTDQSWKSCNRKMSESSKGHHLHNWSKLAVGYRLHEIFPRQSLKPGLERIQLILGNLWVRIKSHAIERKKSAPTNLNFTVLGILSKTIKHEQENMDYKHWTETSYNDKDNRNCK